MKPVPSVPSPQSVEGPSAEALRASPASLARLARLAAGVLALAPGCGSNPPLAELVTEDVALGVIEDGSVDFTVEVRGLQDEEIYLYFAFSQAALGDEVDEVEFEDPPLDVPAWVLLDEIDVLVDVELSVNCVPELDPGPFIWNVPVVAGRSNAGVWTATTAAGDLTIRGDCPFQPSE